MCVANCSKATFLWKIKLHHSKIRVKKVCEWSTWKERGDECVQCTLKCLSTALLYIFSNFTHINFNWITIFNKTEPTLNSHDVLWINYLVGIYYYNCKICYQNHWSTFVDYYEKNAIKEKKRRNAACELWFKTFQALILMFVVSFRLCR